MERRAGTPQGIVLTIPATLTVMGIVLLSPILPQLHAQFAQVPNSDFLVPLVLTIPATCLALFSPVAGWLADRVGRRRLLMASFVVYAIFGVAPVWLEGLWPIFWSRVGVGIAEAFVLTVSTTMIGDYFTGTERDRWLANQTAVASISALAFFVLGGELGQYGWRTPFFVYASSLLMLLAVWRLTWEPSGDARRAAPSARTSGAGVPFPWRRILGICAVTLLASIFFFILQVQMGLALAERGVTSPRLIGWLTALASLGVPIGTLLFRAAARRLSIAQLLTLEFAIIGVGFLAMSYAPDYRLFMIAGALNQVGCGMILPTLLTWSIRGLVFENRGRGMGWWQGTFSVGQTLSAIAIASVVRLLGDGLTPAFQYFGYVALVACALAAVSSLRAQNVPHAVDEGAPS